MPKKDDFVCCLCGKISTGPKHNPSPLRNEGKCCDQCNQNIVIPKKIEIIKRIINNTN